MAVALAITGLIALWTATNPDSIKFIFGTKYIFFILIFAELILVGSLAGWIMRMSVQIATLAFILYAILNGLTLSVIFLIYTTDSIASTFFITAGTFAVMSIYGYMTGSDLTKLGNILIMCLIGLIIASLINLVYQNETLYWITTYAGVLIFTGLIAYDTQKIKKAEYYRQ